METNNQPIPTEATYWNAMRERLGEKFGEKLEFVCQCCGQNATGFSFFGHTPTLCQVCLETERLKQEAERRRIHLGEQIESSGVPLKSLAFTPERVDVVQKFLEGAQGLYVWGPTGRGKTVLAAHVAKEWLLAGKGSMRFLTANRLICEAQDTYRQNSSVSPLDYADRLSRLGLLVVDDIGRQKVTEDAKRILFEIVDQRTKTNRKTLFTSEKNLDAIAQLLDEAFVGRILESCDVLHFEGRNLRLPDMAGRGGQE